MYVRFNTFPLHLGPAAIYIELQTIFTLFLHLHPSDCSIPHIFHPFTIIVITIQTNQSTRLGLQTHPFSHFSYIFHQSDCSLMVGLRCLSLYVILSLFFVILINTLVIKVIITSSILSDQSINSSSILVLLLMHDHQSLYRCHHNDHEN